ncbi:MAG TPA: serine/threonine-protein kinase [Vicinamibacterales bacterium]|jgi:eukaryotic-like serine/threonine-protein kinase|nr:serine/threonine-protein kinase [Vicinamibacterales bacterium]
MVATTGRSQSVADGRFQSLTLIGSGGMGIVYAATDTLTRRPVALKLARRRPGSLKRSNDLLQREALALALAGGRHVCSLYDLAEHAGQTCLVMERLIGESLEARLLRGRLTTLELLDLAIQIASALKSIHALGLVHQDIKPSNTFVTRGGVVKILDFGIATWAGARSEGGTFVGRAARSPIMGSPHYVSPERLMRAPADPRSDLFSFGIVLYEMATGTQPFAATAPVDMIFNVLEARPVPLGTAAPERPAALERILHKLLARRTLDRYQTAGAVLGDLRRLRARLVAGAGGRRP